MRSGFPMRFLLAELKQCIASKSIKFMFFDLEVHEHFETIRKNCSSATDDRKVSLIAISPPERNWISGDIGGTGRRYTSVGKSFVAAKYGQEAEETNDGGGECSRREARVGRFDCERCAVGD